MIACTRRSGSTMLAQHLWNTGVLGAPWEYLNPIAMQRASSRWSITTDVEYVANLVKFRTSENGVFGYKTFIDHWRQANQFYPYIIQSLWSANVIFLRRKNTVAQAISLLRAEKSQQWAAFRGQDNESARAAPDALQFDKEKVDFYLQRIVRQDNLWNNMFKEKAVFPIELWYEDLLQDKDGTIRMILDAWKVERKTTCGAMPKFPETERQADDVSALWIELYNAVT
jgi:trehalose 2-sulfotransferase